MSDCGTSLLIQHLAQTYIRRHRRGERTGIATGQFYNFNHGPGPDGRDRVALFGCVALPSGLLPDQHFVDVIGDGRALLLDIAHATDGRDVYRPGTTIRSVMMCHQWRM